MSEQESNDNIKLAPFPVIANGFTNMSHVVPTTYFPKPDSTVAAGNKGTVISTDGSLLANQLQSSLRVKVDLPKQTNSKKRVTRPKVETQPANPSSHTDNQISPAPETNERDVPSRVRSLRPRRATTTVGMYVDDE